MAVEPGSLEQALSYLIRSPEEPSTGWITDADMMQAVREIFTAIGFTESAVEQAVTESVNVLGDRVTNLEDLWTETLQSLMSTVTVNLVASDEDPHAQYYPETSTLVLYLPRPADGVAGADGADGEDGPIFQYQRISNVASPLVLHDMELFPRPTLAARDGAWLYMLRYDAPTPDPVPTDEEYTVAKYYGTRIGMWIWSTQEPGGFPLNPLDPADDVLQFGANTSPFFDNEAVRETLLNWTYQDEWPYPDHPQPVFTRVGPWQYIGDFTAAIFQGFATFTVVEGVDPNEAENGSFWFYTAGNPSGNALPPGGLTNQGLIKASDDDYDTDWEYVVKSDNSVLDMVVMTAAEYAALNPKVSTTLYVIVG